MLLVEDLDVLWLLEQLIGRELLVVPGEDGLDGGDGGLEWEAAVQEQRVIQRRPRPGMAVQAFVVDLHQGDRGGGSPSGAVRRQPGDKGLLHARQRRLPGLAHERQAEKRHDEEEGKKRSGGTWTDRGGRLPGKHARPYGSGSAL